MACDNAPAELHDIVAAGATASHGADAITLAKFSITASTASRPRYFVLSALQVPRTSRFDLFICAPRDTPRGNCRHFLMRPR